MEGFESELDWNIRRVNEWLATANNLWKALDTIVDMSKKDHEQWQQAIIGSWARARSFMDDVVYALAHAQRQLAEKDIQINRMELELMRCGLYITNGELRYMRGDHKVERLDIDNAALCAEDRDTLHNSLA
jgi:DNA-binding protein YbaB